MATEPSRTPNNYRATADGSADNAQNLRRALVCAADDLALVIAQRDEARKLAQSALHELRKR